MEFEKDVSLKYWYLFNYPEDDMGEDINPRATFAGLVTHLFGDMDVYDYIGVGDSLVRERLFHQLAKQLDTSYDYVYNLWLN